MTSVQLDLGSELVAGLSPVQGSFLDVLQDALSRLSPSLLDLDRSDVTVADGSVLRVHLAHRDDPSSHLEAAVGEDEALVTYGPEQQAFDAGDPGHGNPWPFPAPDHGAAAARLVEQLLAGRVRVRAKPGVLQERRVVAWQTDDGQVVSILRSGSFRLRRHPDPPTVQTWDYGCSA